MAVDGCGLVCKYFLLIFNIIFAVLGIAFLSLGMWLRFSNDTRGFFQIEELNSSAFVIAVTVLIILGSVMLIVSAFGDYGACNEKICALQVFICLLALLTVAEVVVGVLVYSRKDEIGWRAGEFYTTMYVLYAKTADPIIGATLTFTHNLLHCCGVSGVKVLESTCPRPASFIEHLVMPNCPATIVTVFDSKASLVMGIFLGTGALLFTALICSIILRAKIRPSPPQYTSLTYAAQLQPNPLQPHPLQPAQHELFTTQYAHPDPGPVVFTPLTVANVPPVKP